MIESLSTSNFKCLGKHKIAFRNLTVLCGQNNVGKSTCIQAFLFGNEIGRRNRESGSISLNNILNHDFGTLADIQSEQPDSQEICLFYEYSSKGEVQVWSFTIDANPDHLEDAFVRVVSKGRCPQSFKEGTRQFAYLSAERFGPRGYLPLQSVPDETMTIGSSGQYVSELLQRFERQKVRDSLRLPQSKNLETLQLQVEAWMGLWVSNIQIKAATLQDVCVSELRFRKKGLTSNWKRPSNIGFGVSYSLPIVVAGLSAPIDSLLIVDTPEAHLHPAGQSAIGLFLAQVAASGVQVIVETHSDHILNGIRLAVAQTDHPIKPEQVLLNNFSKVDDSVNVEEITIDHRGELSSWPKQFFDQIEQDLAKIYHASV